MALEPKTTTEFEDAKKVTRADLQGLADAITSLQERLAIVEAHLQSDSVAYGGTPLDASDDDYVEVTAT